MTGALSRDRSGASAIEFAILCPVFVVLLFAALVFGQAFYAIGTVQWAIERSARAMMLDGAFPTAQFEAEVRAATDGLAGMDYAIDYADTDYGGVVVTEIRTTLRYPVRIPIHGDIWLEYPVTTQAPRPAAS